MLKHAAGKRRERGFTKASEKALQLGLLLLPLPWSSQDQSSGPIVPVRRDERSPSALRVWPECPDSADPSAVSPHPTFPASFPAEAHAAPHTAIPSSSPITLQTPSCAPHSAPSSLIFLAQLMTPFELHLFFVKSSP